MKSTGVLAAPQPVLVLSFNDELRLILIVRTATYLYLHDAGMHGGHTVSFLYLGKRCHQPED